MSKNGHYIVSQLYLSGKGKKIWKSGDVVTRLDFPENFDVLLSEGRIKFAETSGAKESVPFEDSDSKKSEKATDEKSEGSDSVKTALFIFDPNGINKPIYDYKDITRTQLIKHLAVKQITFDPAAKKDQLWALLEL
jgi:hypothetical protein